MAMALFDRASALCKWVVSLLDRTSPVDNRSAVEANRDLERGIDTLPLENVNVALPIAYTNRSYDHGVAYPANVHHAPLTGGRIDPLAPTQHVSPPPPYGEHTRDTLASGNGVPSGSTTNGNDSGYVASWCDMLFDRLRKLLPSFSDVFIVVNPTFDPSFRGWSQYPYRCTLGCPSVCHVYPWMVHARRRSGGKRHPRSSTKAWMVDGELEECLGCRRVCPALELGAHDDLGDEWRYVECEGSYWVDGIRRPGRIKDLEIRRIAGRHSHELLFH